MRIPWSYSRIMIIVKSIMKLLWSTGWVRRVGVCGDDEEYVENNLRAARQLE